MATKNDEAIIFDLYVRVMKKYISEIWGWDQEWQENDFKVHFNLSDFTIIKDANRAIGYSKVEDKREAIFIFECSYSSLITGARVLERAY